MSTNNTIETTTANPNLPVASAWGVAAWRQGAYRPVSKLLASYQESQHWLETWINSPDGLGRQCIIYQVNGGPWIINGFGWDASAFEPETAWDDDSDDSNDPSANLPPPPECLFLFGYKATDGSIRPVGRIWSAIEDARQGGDELHTVLCEGYFADADPSCEVHLFRCVITNRQTK